MNRGFVCLFAVVATALAACSSADDSSLASGDESEDALTQKRTQTYCEGPGLDQGEVVAILIKKTTGNYPFVADVQSTSQDGKTSGGGAEYSFSGPKTLLTRGGSGSGEEFGVQLGKPNAAGEQTGKGSVVDIFVQDAPIKCSVRSAERADTCLAQAKNAAGATEMKGLRDDNAKDPRVDVMQGQPIRVIPNANGAEVWYWVHVDATSDNAGGEWPAHITYRVKMKMTDGSKNCTTLEATSIASFM